jgi:hypothetical protein
VGADEFEGMSGEFEPEEFAAAFAERFEGGEEALAAFGGEQGLFGIGTGVGEGEFVDGGGVIFAAAVAFADMGCDLETQDLEGDGEEVLGRVEMAVLLVEHEEGLLDEIFGGAGLDSGCREGANPFKKEAEGGVAITGWHQSPW